MQELHAIEKNRGAAALAAAPRAVFIFLHDGKFDMTFCFFKSVCQYFLHIASI